MYDDRSRRREPDRGDYRGGPHEGRGRGHGDRDRDRGDRDRGERRGTPLSDLDPALTEVSRRLIGCAIEVHKSLGPGFDESVYERALEVELKANNIAFKAQHPVPVRYRDVEVGARTADLLIEDRFIVDLMALRGEIGGTERASLRALLRAADLELGLIINFAERRLKDGLVRVLNPDKLNAMHEGEGEFEDGEEGEEAEEREGGEE